jgi:hypothetical protein
MSKNNTIYRKQCSLYEKGLRGSRGEVHTGFGWGNLRERGNLENLGVNGRIILKWVFNR